MPALTFQDFLLSAPGELLLEWEKKAYSELTADVFGSCALQIGMPQLDTLAANRMQAHWLIDPRGNLCDPKFTLNRIVADPSQLPILNESMDLVTLPHTLDLAPNPQQILREAVRVLEPEGRLILTAFNSLGLWWLRQQTVKLGCRPYLPTELVPISLYRLKDWLALLGLEVDRGIFGIYAPGFRSLKRLHAWSWLNKAGDRWMPQFSNLFLLSAVKRLPGPRIVSCESMQKLPGKMPAPGVPAASSTTHSTLLGKKL